MILEPFIGPIPSLTTVVTTDKAISWLNEAIASCCIESVWCQSMHDQCMCIEWSIGLAILPRLASIQTSHKRTSFYGSKETASDQWIGRNPTNMACIWT